MIDIDTFVRKQTMLDNLIGNLKDLYEEKHMLLNALIQTEKIITTHENFLNKLEEEDD